MIRIRTILTGGISSVALALALTGVSVAQTTQPPDSTMPGTTTKPSGKDATQAQREEMDREKAALKDRVQQTMAATDANVDALKKMDQGATAADKKRNMDVQQRLSDLRTKLQTDADKIDGATPQDWNGIKTAVRGGLRDMQSELRVSQNITHVQVPRTGAASKQPPDQTQKPEQRYTPTP
jgi:hypothetical protein